MFDDFAEWTRTYRFDDPAKLDRRAGIADLERILAKWERDADNILQTMTKEDYENGFTGLQDILKIEKHELAQEEKEREGSGGEAAAGGTSD